MGVLAAEFKEVLAMARGFVPLTRAARRYRSAVSMQRGGSTHEAFDAAREALCFLRRPSVARTSPPALTLILSATGLLDEVALALGDQAASKAAMADALEACRLAISRHPGLGELEHVRASMAAFEQRLEGAGGGAPY